MKKSDGDKIAWPNYVGLGLLAVCYAGALLNVCAIRRAETDHEVIRLVHWQLELGVRDGVDDLIRRFEEYQAAKGRKVRVVQIPMPEQSYVQYVTTQLIGGTAPDMIQLGKFPDEYLGRYFLPVSEAVQNLNPFLAAEAAADPDNALLATLAQRPWMDTFTDGLRTMFYDRFQEYYGVGFSQFTIRMFYNRTLFEEVLGSPEPPANYRELLEACRRIEEYAAQQNITLHPIASSRYQMEYFKGQYLSGLTRDVAIHYDTNLDGNFGGEEKMMAVLSGRSGPTDPRYRAGLESARRIADYFPRGFMALERMDSAFAFVQGRAAMITSGSWDARSFMRQIENQPPERRFEVGIFELPQIAPDDPEFGKYFDGPASEAGTGTGFAFGITRNTKNYDLCVEFLQFATTPQNNSLLNDHAAWIPSVTGARMDPVLEVFRPNFIGLWGGMDLRFVARGRCETLESQVFWPYISGEVSYDEYAATLMEQLPPEMAQDFRRLYESRDEALPGLRTTRSTFLAATVFGPQDERITNEQKLLRACSSQAVYERGKWDMRIMLKKTREELDKQGHTPFSTQFFNSLDRWYNMNLEESL